MSVATAAMVAKPKREEPSHTRTALRILLLFGMATLLLRIQALQGLGFTNVEALFASYSLHPQPVYFSHPGLIAVVMRWAGWGDVPNPEQAHLFAAALAALVPWVGMVAARGTGAGWANSLLTAVAFAIFPVFLVEHSALSPDLLVALAWPAAIGCAALALRSERGSWEALLGWLGAGTLSGVLMMSHAIGGLLALALLIGCIAAGTLAQWRTAPPWAAVTLAIILGSPILHWELSHGLTLLQANVIAGPAPFLLQLGWVLLGVVVIVTPLPLLASAVLLQSLTARRSDNVVEHLLWVTVVGTIGLVVPFAIWSPCGGPTWLLPAFVPLGLHLARHPEVVQRWLGTGCTLSGAVVAVGAWMWIKTELPIQALGDRYPKTRDVANQLYTWGPGRGLLADALDASIIRLRRFPVVVGVSTGTCAQVQAAVGQQVPVGCMVPVESEFNRWYPASKWSEADSILLVYDDDFTGNPAVHFPNHTVITMSKVNIRRAGRVVRTIRIVSLDKVRDIALDSPILPYRDKKPVDAPQRER